MIAIRYRRIVLFWARILASFIFWDLFLPVFGLRKLAERTRSERIRRSAAAFRNLAVHLGGVLIKVGQFLSTRVDVLPEEFTGELKGLQDEVPPEQFEEIRMVAEAEYGCKLEERFLSFETQPLAAASLGQVHLAELRSHSSVGSSSDWVETPAYSVVVKIQRPNIEKIIETDLAALRTVGAWISRYPPIRRRANIPALIGEFSRTLYEEIDYLAEGRNAEIFAENFKDDPGVRVPKVIWSHTTMRALTLENVLAIKITDYGDIESAGISREDVASRLLDTYLKQIFEDGFFHADPHPGNLFVYPIPDQTNEDGKKPGWQLTFVDFGMVGRMPPNTREGMREMLIGVGTQDSARVVKSFQMLGVLLPNADLSLIEKAEEKAFERFWGKNMTELTRMSTSDVREFSGEFRELLYSMPFQVPQDFIFLARAVGILSGMCTGLDPQFNVWEHLAPYAQKLITQEVRGSREVLLDELKKLVRILLAAPARIDALLVKAERGELVVREPELSERVTRLEIAVRQIAVGIVFTAFLMAGVQVYLAGQWVAALLAGFGAFLSLIWLVLIGRRSR